MEETKMMNEAAEVFDQKQSRKDFSKLGFVYLIGGILYVGGQLLCAFLAEVINPALLDDFNVAVLIQTMPVYIIAVPVFMWLVSRLPATVPEKHPMKVSQFLGAVCCVYAAGILSNIVGLIITNVLGNVMDHEISNQVAELVGDLNPWVSLLLMVILAPVVEELLFRKLLITRILKYGEGVAVLLSGLLFGLLHGNLNQFAYAFTLGCFFAFIYVKTGNIKLTIGLHMIINFLGSVAIGLLVQVFDFFTVSSQVEWYLAQGKIDELTLYISQNMVGIVAYGLYLMLLFGMVITGVVLLIIGAKKFRLSKGQVVVPKGKRFLTVILNPGMLLYIAGCVLMIVLQAVL